MDSIDRCDEGSTRRTDGVSALGEPPASTGVSTSSSTEAVRTDGGRRNDLRTDGGCEEGAAFDRAVDEDPIAVAVVEAVAAVSGETVESLPPLGKTIDADALEALFAPTTDGRHREGAVTFLYAGYEVTVRNGETVVVRDTE